jgi:hypothetical protein
MQAEHRLLALESLQTAKPFGSAGILPMTMPSNEFDAAVISRRSTHAVLPTPVAHAEIEAILETACRAPSGTRTP